ncbi:MAG: GDSL-type esterase/lipase family protein [Eubacteriales bacterium]|nr:GDSL-type esterase/lipase family protein [Eubacteriales bacterium]
MGKTNEKEKNKKVPFAVMRKGMVGLALAGIMVCSPIMLAGCSNGKDGKNGLDGAKWYSGIDYSVDTNATNAKAGDFYIDTDDHILYQKQADETWVVLMQNFGKPGSQGPQGNPGQNGTNGTDGTDGTNGTDGATWLTGTVITGKGSSITAEVAGAKVGDLYFNTTTCDIYQCTAANTWNWISNIKGEQGEQGDKGDDGTSVYVGYDGYIWNGTERTELNFCGSLDANVVENTIGIQGTMSKYFAGSYIDLSSNSIALMANYKPNVKLTQYGSTNVTEIKVVSENAGTLQIGTAKVADIVTARTTGTTYSASTTSYDLVAGVNTITLDLNVAEDETIVLGGNGSTAKLYVANGIPVTDEVGNFSLVNGQTNSDVIAKTGDYADTLAVQVKAEVIGEEVAIFSDLKSNLTNLATADTVKNEYAPFVYTNFTHFAGKHITRIDIPIKSVKPDTNPTFTVKVVKQTDVTNKSSTIASVKAQTLTFTETVDTSTSNKWVTATCDIYVGEDETLLFGDPTDTIMWGYHENASGEPVIYQFYTKVGTSGQGGPHPSRIYFDIYETPSTTFDEHLAELEQKEQEAQEAQIEAQLASILGGKQLSILGDSISTFEGVSNNSDDGLGDNAIYYDTELTQEDTYWQQIITKYNMNLCVNNSWSGSYVSKHAPNQNANKDADGSVSSGMARADNLAKKDGTTPDYILVYIGINDLNAGVPADTIATAYNTMLDTITATYPSAKVFCVNMPNRNTGNSPVAYNTAIKTAVDSHTNVYLIDLYSSEYNGATYETNSLDNLHPNAVGMDYMTQIIIDGMKTVLLAENN